MKTKNAVFLPLIGIVGTLGSASLAVGDEAPKAEKYYVTSMKLTLYEPGVYLLKSSGREIAALRLQRGATVEVESSADPAGRITLDTARKSLTASNGVNLRIILGGHAVTVTADEIIMNAVEPIALPDFLQQENVAPAKLIRLKSGAETIAELKIPKGKSFGLGGKQGHSYLADGRTTMTGGAELRISSVVAKADEIEAVDDSQ